MSKPTLNLENNLLENVTLFYGKIKTPSLKYQSQTEKEFAITAIVDKQTAKAFGKQFPKQKPKEIDNDEFNERYGEQYAIDGQDEQFLITLKKAATYKDKETDDIKDIPDAYRPRVFIDDGNGELEDITFTKLIGNGSKGTVQFEVMENSYGTFAKLLAVKVDELVEVQQGDSAGKFNVLGKIKSLADNPKSIAKTEDVNGVEHKSELADDDIPFNNTNNDEW